MATRLTDKTVAHPSAVLIQSGRTTARPARSAIARRHGREAGMPTYDCVDPARDDAIVKPGTASPACQRCALSGASTPSDRKKVRGLQPKRRQCRIHRASGPEPVELRKRERAIVALNVVPHIEDEASVLAPIPGASQSPSDHLEVEIRAVHGSGHNDGTCLWGVKAFAEDAVVHQRPDLAAPKPFDDAPTRCGLRGSAYGARRYPKAEREAAMALRRA